MHSKKKMELISTNDIGILAAKTLLEGPQTWGDQTIGLAGDELTFGEAQEAFKRALGYDMPMMWTIVGQGVRWVIEEARTSMRWFDDEGFGVDINALKDTEVSVMDFETWLRVNYGDSQDE